MERMTKAQLIDLLRMRRAEYDAVIDAIPTTTMLEPGAAGYWSVKDIIAHLTYYEGWMADRLHDQVAGKPYTPGELDMMHWEARNQIIYERTRDLPLGDVLTASKATFQRLIAGVEAHDETFLFQPQTFDGAPGPIVVADMLRSEVYDHYPQHVPDLLAWVERQRRTQHAGTSTSAVDSSVGSAK
jgi:hypothetical protein